MSQTLFIICPLTKEIIPYQFNLTDTFQPILIDLQSRGKPSNLVYYDGQQVIPILADYQIQPFFPPRQSQVLIYAIDHSKQSLPILAVPVNYLLILLIKWDLRQIIPRFVSTADTIGQIINDLKLDYNLSVTITRLQGQKKDDVLDSEKTINQILPFRTEQIILLLNDQSAILNQISLLEALPDELIIRTLIELPVTDILALCQTSSRLAEFCHDEPLWKQLVQRDFELDVKPAELNWRKWYQQLATMTDDDFLLQGATLGDIKMVQFILNKDYINHIILVKVPGLFIPTAEDKYHTREEAMNKGYIDIIKFDTALSVATEGGYREIIQMIIDTMSKKNLTPRYNELIAIAAKAGQRDTVKMMIDLMLKNNIQPHYNAIMALSATAEQSEIVQLMLNYGANNYNEVMLNAVHSKNIKIIQLMSDHGATNYNKAMDIAASKGYKEIFQFILNIMKIKNIHPNYNSALLLAVQEGHTELVKMLIKLGANNYNQGLLKAAKGGYLDIVQMMLELGANEYQAALNIAENIAVIRLIAQSMWNINLEPSYMLVLMNTISELVAWTDDSTELDYIPVLTDPISELVAEMNNPIQLEKKMFNILDLIVEQGIEPPYDILITKILQEDLYSAGFRDPISLPKGTSYLVTLSPRTVKLINKLKQYQQRTFYIKIRQKYILLSFNQEIIYIIFATNKFIDNPLDKWFLDVSDLQEDNSGARLMRRKYLPPYLIIIGLPIVAGPESINQYVQAVNHLVNYQVLDILAAKKIIEAFKAYN